MKPRDLIQTFLEKKGGGKSIDAKGKPMRADPNSYYATLPSSEGGGFVYYSNSKSKSKEGMCDWFGSKEAMAHLENALKNVGGRGDVDEINPYKLYVIRKTDQYSQFQLETWKPTEVCAKKKSPAPKPSSSGKKRK